MLTPAQCLVLGTPQPADTNALLNMMATMLSKLNERDEKREQERFEHQRDFEQIKTAIANIPRSSRRSTPAGTPASVTHVPPHRSHSLPQSTPLTHSPVKTGGKAPLREAAIPSTSNGSLHTGPTRDRMASDGPPCSQHLPNMA